MGYVLPRHRGGNRISNMALRERIRDLVRRVERKREMPKTQCEKVLDYMREKGSISSMEAFGYLRITRLSARIWDLRHQGYVIESVPTQGMSGTYDKYVLKEDTKKDGEPTHIC